MHARMELYYMTADISRLFLCQFIVSLIDAHVART